MGTGTDLEKRTEKALIELGYTTHRTHNSPPVFAHGRWISPADNDILGCFDCLAVAPYNLTRLVQSTVLAHVSERRHKVDACLPFNPHNVFVEVWGWHKVKRRWAVRVWRRMVSGPTGVCASDAGSPGIWQELEGMG